MIDCPRLLIAGTHSGSGKTTATCGLLRAVMKRGLHPAAFKCGPDYIDSMIHRQVVEAESGNLDLFLSDEDWVRSALAESALQGVALAIIEGVMGYYDGLGGIQTEASAYHVAKATGTPVILVLDGRGASLSLAATLKGFLTFRTDHQIKGVLLNRCSAALYQKLAPVIEAETGVPVLGYIPGDERWALESRHLGLVTAMEIQGLREKLDVLASTLLETVDIEALLEIAHTAPPLPQPQQREAPPVPALRLAVADDEAFCFRYAENLALLRQLGAEPVCFSPLQDQALPSGVHGLYLCGGYPELYMRQLSENQALRMEIHNVVQGGLPTWAECGGFMYLMEAFRDGDGIRYPLCGILPGECFQTKRLQRFGYARLTAQKDTLLLGAGESMPMHSFHYSDCTQPGDACLAQKSIGDWQWHCVQGSETLFAGYPHLYLPGTPRAAERFVSAMRKREGQKYDAV